ncbi:hypothetical protein AB0C77_37790 [Streptomyces sp. NPDC048629]|uniref:hypothetical protein n=1 Tax=Streptomyces sp. NPDC048629 TaxID=3154824 RepID=UPI0034492F6A
MTDATRYDRRMYAVMNDRRAQSLYATAARRRAVAGAHIALTLAGIAAAVFWPGLWGGIALLVLLLPWAVATGAINGATRGLFELRGRMLDERQLVERDRVRSIAHRVTGVLLAVGTLVAVVAPGSTGVRPDRMLVPLLAAALVLHWLTPLWVAMLRVEDEPADDEA